MFGLFKPKANEVIDAFQKQAFLAWGVQTEDVATTLRFRAALAIYTSILLSMTHPNRSLVTKISNEILSKVILSVADKQCRVSDVLSISATVQCINFSNTKFLADANISSPNVIMNGRGVIDSLVQAYGSDCVTFLQGREGGNLMNAGMMLLKDLTVGNGDRGDFILSVHTLSQHYMEFFDKILKASR